MVPSLIRIITSPFRAWNRYSLIFFPLISLRFRGISISFPSRIKIHPGLSNSTRYAVPSWDTCKILKVEYATCRSWQIGSVSTIVSTHSSNAAPFKNMVPSILEVSVDKILALTPLPMPSARIRISESSVFRISTLSPQSTSENLFRLLYATST